METRVLLKGGLAAAVVVIVVTQGGAALAADPTKEQCIASSEQGQQLRGAAKLRDASTQFAICITASCPGPIRDDCAQRLDELVKAMPSFLFEVTDSAGNDVPGVTITVDGQLVAGAGNAVGTAVEIDPGEHTFSFAAAGLKKAEKRLVIVEGVKQRREVVIMDRADAEPTASIASPSAAETSPPTGEAPTRSSHPPTLALVAFGVGGAGLTLGVVAGLVAGGKHSTLEGACDNSAGTCSPTYADDLDAFHSWRTISTAGYVVGALGVAGGAVLWFTAPKERNAAATNLWLGPASAGIAGRF